MKKVLGSHGIEAWDEGREITILRWGMGAGYISYDEAIKLIEPVVERIKANYVSWEDFTAHYIDSLPEDNSDYISAKYEYMYSANNIGRPDLTLNVFEALPVSLKKNIYFYYQYACAYYIYSEITPSETEKTIYQSRAVNAFKQVEKEGVELNDFVKKWIESVE